MWSKIVVFCKVPLLKAEYRFNLELQNLDEFSVNTNKIWRWQIGPEHRLLYAKMSHSRIITYCKWDIFQPINSYTPHQQQCAVFKWHSFQNPSWTLHPHPHVYSKTPPIASIHVPTAAAPLEELIKQVLEVAYFSWSLFYYISACTCSHEPFNVAKIFHLF